MRKLLLATTAVVGAAMGMTSFASAQTMAPGTYVLGGTVITKRTAGHASTYGNNNYLNGEAEKGPVANPTPGTAVVHLGFIVLSEVGAAWSSADTSSPGNKVNPIFEQTYVRIYPGVDAMAANGLRYGAAVELRQNFFGNPLGMDGTPAKQTGSAGGTTESTNQTIFVRREFVYLGADHLGVLRVGETDGVIGTFDEGGRTTGVFLSPTGTIVGGDLQGTTVGGWMDPYFGAQSGNEYATEKFFYDSPSFYGFDVAFQYSPNVFNSFGDAAGNYAAGGFIQQSSATVADGSSVEKNLYAVGLRYQGDLGPAAVLAYGVYMGSGHVHDPAGVQFQNLSLGMFGANVTVAGVSVFGNVMIGKYNGVLGTTPDGAPNATGFGAGAAYKFGPWQFGGVYSQFDSQGTYTDVGTGQNHSWVAYLAGEYHAAPGLTFYADYGYGQTHQGGAFSAGNGRTQAFLVGTAVTW